ncbi:MAG: protein kinase [Candidatus Eisenbacteria bacterium]|nr:protein kinase [Candidatus Eisenbacteria bacterium]
MPLAPGVRLGPYEIVAPLGAGGMGEVYRARDPRLDRDVAIKALPEGFAGDAERLARFDREARLLAALSHPNIGAIFGLEEKDDARYLVLEFIEGEPLSARIARGALPAREALEIATQIAAAVEAAHERGIVHRDLKPGNVMLTPARIAKVLDFGLAKGAAGDGASSSAGPVAAHLSVTPTVAMSATGAGIILGTAPYMSPEQARGQAVDRRTDVWAFGCVVYECLAGRQAFAGETVSDVIARILERDPEWGAMPASAPPRLREIVRRCLIKDAAARPRDIGDLRRELVSIAQELAAPSSVSGAARETPSLAVLYFENIASDKESEYFCAGITEDILTDLSKINGLRVASRNAVARYRGAPVDIAKVGAELGVKAVLEGSVRRAGDRVRITAQLINAADGFHLWAERYDRTLADVFAVQEEIASSIAAALRVALSPAESAKLVADRPSDARAYDLYLKGRQRYSSYSAESLREALDLFHQAIAIDPDYALAWAGVADVHGQIIQWGRSKNRDEDLRLGLDAAERAITLNPRLPEAYKARGLMYTVTGDLESARQALNEALKCDPRFVPALINLAASMFPTGDLAGTERHVRRALDADPQYPFTVAWLGLLDMLIGRHDACLATADRLQPLSNDPFYLSAVYSFRVWGHVMKGDLAAAERVQRECESTVRDPRIKSSAALIASYGGRTDEARRLIAELSALPDLGTGHIMLCAPAAMRAGLPEQALGLLARPLMARSAPLTVRLVHDLHPLLDRPPYGPRRSDLTLVWPLEADMIDPARFALFKEVKIESAMPSASELGGAR